MQTPGISFIHVKGHSFTEEDVNVRFSENFDFFFLRFFFEDHHLNGIICTDPF